MPVTDGKKIRSVNSMPTSAAKSNMSASEPCNCHEKKLTVMVATFCRANTTANAPRAKPRMKNMIIRFLF